MHTSNEVTKKDYKDKNAPGNGDKYKLLMKKFISVTAVN